MYVCVFVSMCVGKYTRTLVCKLRRCLHVLVVSVSHADCVCPGVCVHRPPHLPAVPAGRHPPPRVLLLQDVSQCPEQVHGEELQREVPGACSSRMSRETHGLQREMWFYVDDVKVSPGLRETTCATSSGGVIVSSTCDRKLEYDCRVIERRRSLF